MVVNDITYVVQSVTNSKAAFCKFLSSNDTGATGGHQVGILISKSAKDMMFEQSLENENILKRIVKIIWENNYCTESVFTYYSSKNELRITRFGRNFPFLAPEQTGSLFVLTQQDEDDYSAFILDTESKIESFLDTFSISPADTNRLIDNHTAGGEYLETEKIQSFIAQLEVEFPSSQEMSTAAREIQNLVYDHISFIKTDPDRKVIDWTNMEYTLFKAIEHARYGSKIESGFESVEEFVKMANMVLNRRKSRAGKSFENHLAAIFDGNDIQYTSQAVTEGNKKPDFLFPSKEAYDDLNFSTEKIISLAAKTTCKDRWRQVLNEANRLRDKTKYLCTMQQGISPAQMDEMQDENVTLVVPKPFIVYYPKDRRDRIWTLSKFVDYVKYMEGNK